jgi:toxin ParE1/3/4
VRRSVTLTPQAERDLDDIWHRIAQDNLTAADRHVDRIVERCRALAEHPKIGRMRSDIAPGARMLVVDDYLVLYREAGEGIDIVRVVQGARRLKGLFGEDEAS